MTNAEAPIASGKPLTASPSASLPASKPSESTSAAPAKIGDPSASPINGDATTKGSGSLAGESASVEQSRVGQAPENGAPSAMNLVSSENTTSDSPTNSTADTVRSHDPALAVTGGKEAVNVSTTTASPTERDMGFDVPLPSILTESHAMNGVGDQGMFDEYRH